MINCYAIVIIEWEVKGYTGHSFFPISINLLSFFLSANINHQPNYAYNINITFYKHYQFPN